MNIRQSDMSLDLLEKQNACLIIVFTNICILPLSHIPCRKLLYMVNQESFITACLCLCMYVWMHVVLKNSCRLLPVFHQRWTENTTRSRNIRCPKNCRWVQRPAWYVWWYCNLDCDDRKGTRSNATFHVQPLVDRTRYCMLAALMRLLMTIINIHLCPWEQSFCYR